MTEDTFTGFFWARFCSKHCDCIATLNPYIDSIYDSSQPHLMDKEADAHEVNDLLDVCG